MRMLIVAPHSTNRSFPFKMSRFLLTISNDSVDHIIGGATYQWKDAIKALKGAKWSPAERIWRIPMSTDIAELVNAYNKHLEDTMHPHYGVCCTLAKLEDEYYMGPLCYRCPKHGTRGHSKKAGYTGD